MQTHIYEGYLQISMEESDAELVIRLWLPEHEIQ